MSTTEINGHTYAIGKMDARRQFHVARRLAPVMMGLMKASGQEKADFVTTVGPLAEAVSGLSDEDCDYVLDSCLDVVSRLDEKAGGKPIKIVRGGVLAYQDITMPEIIQLAVAVIQDNLSGFFPAGA